MTKTAVIIDTISIQQYVYGSNKLQENIGASHIVANEIYALLDKDNILYQGGGNAVLLFDDESVAKKFINSYSLEISKRYSGIKLAFGILENFDDTLGHYQESMNQMHKSLQRNKSENYIQVNPFKPGIVADCTQTGEAAMELKHEKVLSNSSIIKHNYAERGNTSLAENFESKLGNYRFPSEFEKLGQIEGKGYIAIVHIDGNGIGQKFKDCKSPEETISLSSDIKKITKRVLEKVCARITHNLEKLKEELPLKLEENTLPFRPLVVGGDDVTVVTEGRLGIYFAELFIQEFKTEEISFPGGKIKMEACAGISIIKTKYPFFLGYTKAEEILSKAKKWGRAKHQENKVQNILYPSCLSFQVQAAGNHEEKECRVFNIVDNFNDLIEINRHFNNSKNNWSKSKIMQFREALFSNQDEFELFKLDCKKKHIVIPKINETKEYSVQTLKDAILFREFYPTFLIKSNE